MLIIYKSNLVENMNFIKDHMTRAGYLFGKAETEYTLMCTHAKLQAYTQYLYDPDVCGGGHMSGSNTPARSEL
jgi:hypothetical protein